MVETSYTNPCGGGNRQQGQILVYVAGGSWSGTASRLVGNSSNIPRSFSDAPFRFGFDFGIPRVIQEVTVSTSGSTPPPASSFYLECAPSWLGPWTTVSIGASYSGATLIIDASGNDTAARYYRIQCTSGRASVDYYNVRFKIDDVNSGWNDTYSGGNRSGLINVTGLNFQHTTVITGAYYDYTSSAFFVESLTTYPTFIFSTPKRVTGIRWGMSGGPATVRDFRIEAANSSSGPWTTLVPSTLYKTEYIGHPDSAVLSVGMWECLFDNDTEYTRYRLVPLGPRVNYTYMLQAIFRIDVEDSSGVLATGPLPRYTYAGPRGGGGVPVPVQGVLPALEWYTPLGSALRAAGGPMPDYTWSAPQGQGEPTSFTGGPLPSVVWSPPTNDNIFNTQYAALAVADQTVNADVTQFTALSLAVLNINIRITQMGLLVLAKGKEPPLLPNPLTRMDGGQAPLLDQRLVNMYVESTPDGPAKDARFGRPGMYAVGQMGPGPVRATFLHKGFRYTVSGDTMWRDQVFIGRVPADGELRWAVSDEEIVVVAGRRAYYVTLRDVTRISDPDLPYVRDVKYLAGRFIYFDDDTSGIYRYSKLGDARNIDGLAFASAELNPDPIVGAEVQGEMLAIFGTLTTEWHYPTTDPNNPFKRSQGRTYDKGCQAIQTVQRADNTLYFVGHDRMVYRSAAAPQRVSTHGIEEALRKQTDAEFRTNSAFKVTFGGHVFYVLNIVGQGTWAYDIGYESWAEWKTWGKDRFRVAVADEDGFMGDYYTGSILSFDGQRYDDLGDPVERIVSTFVPLARGTLKNFNLALYAKQGVGTITGGVEPHPVVEMRFSDHLGLDFTPWMEAPLGHHQVRGRESLAVWTSLGAFNAPGRVFEFRCTDFVEFSPYAAAFNEARL